LIFDDPAPSVVFQDREFCVTGTFAFGKRGFIEKTVETKGGRTVKAPTSDTHYVLVGSFVSHGWTHGNYGTKIERALSLRKSGNPIAIIGEEHWKTFLT
jgi:NAD-dependent DNA ligase